MRIAMMNLVLHGIRKANVKRANTLSDMGGLSEDDLARRYKVILSNPPFAGVLPKEWIRKDLPTNSKKSELLFLGVMMEALAPGGTCAVVVPEGLLFGSTGAHVELRRKLVEDYDLLAVVSLPAGVFKPYAGVKTGVLVFRRRHDSPPLAKGGKGGFAKDSSRHVWFYEIRADGYDPDKIQGGGRPRRRSATTSRSCSRSGASTRNLASRSHPGSRPARPFPRGRQSRAPGGRRSKTSPRTSASPPAATSRRSPSPPPRAIPRSSSARPWPWSARARRGWRSC
jgi:type I restriction enzyme M protein